MAFSYQLDANGRVKLAFIDGSMTAGLRKTDQKLVIMRFTPIKSALRKSRSQCFLHENHEIITKKDINFATCPQEIVDATRPNHRLSALTFYRAAFKVWENADRAAKNAADGEDIGGGIASQDGQASVESVDEESVTADAISRMSSRNVSRLLNIFNNTTAEISEKNLKDIGVALAHRAGMITAPPAQLLLAAREWALDSGENSSDHAPLILWAQPSVELFDEALDDTVDWNSERGESGGREGWHAPMALRDSSSSPSVTGEGEEGQSVAIKPEELPATTADAPLDGSRNRPFLLEDEEDEEVQVVSSRRLVKSSRRG